MRKEGESEEAQLVKNRSGRGSGGGASTLCRDREGANKGGSCLQCVQGFPLCRTVTPRQRAVLTPAARDRSPRGSRGKLPRGTAQGGKGNEERGTAIRERKGGVCQSAPTWKSGAGERRRVRALALLSRNDRPPLCLKTSYLTLFYILRQVAGETSTLFSLPRRSEAFPSQAEST